jgi:hypothetical protein
MNIKVEFINHEYRPKYNKKMKIIGKLGNDVYLVKVDKGNSRVLDLHTKLFHLPFRTQSILAKRYWEEYEPEEGELGVLLSQVTEYKGKKRREASGYEC